VTSILSGLKPPYKSDGERRQSLSEKNLKWATFIFVQTNMSQQTLICLLGQFDKRFSQRSSTILALAHDALAEQQGLPSITDSSVFV
jgi:hypothetical protein